MPNIATADEIRLIWNVDLTPEETAERCGKLETLVQGVRDYQAQHSGVIGLGIFGSFLRPTFNPKKSDIDLVVFEDEVPEEFQLYREALKYGRADYHSFVEGEYPKTYFSDLAHRVTGNYQGFESTRIATTLSDWVSYEDIIRMSGEGSFSMKANPQWIPRRTSLYHFQYLEDMHLVLVPAIMSPKNRRKVDEAVIERMHLVAEEEREALWGFIKLKYDQFVFSNDIYIEEINTQVDEYYSENRERIRRGLFTGGERGASISRSVNEAERAYVGKADQFKLGFVSEDSRLLTGFLDFERRVRETGTHFTPGK